MFQKYIWCWFLNDCLQMQRIWVQFPMGPMHFFFLIEKNVFSSMPLMLIHFLTLSDFRDFLRNNGWEISEKFSESNYLNFSCIHPSISKVWCHPSLRLGKRKHAQALRTHLTGHRINQNFISLNWVCVSEDCALCACPPPHPV